MIGQVVGEDIGLLQPDRPGGVHAELARVAGAGVHRTAAVALHVRRQAAIAEPGVGDDIVALGLLSEVVGRGRIAGARARAAAAVIPADDAELDPVLEPLVKFELELRFQEKLVDNAAFVAGGGRGAEVLEPALGLLFPVAGDAEANALGERARHRGFEQGVVVVRVGAAHLGVEVFGRALGHDVDGAADGVAAVERALRAAQHFDPIDEDRRFASLHGRGGVDAVRIHRNRAIGGVGVAEAADAAQRDAVGLGGILQARREVGDVLDRVDPDKVTLFRRKGGHGHRHVLQALLALFSGDHQFFDGVGSGGRRSGARLGLDRRGGQGRGQQRAGRQESVFPKHMGCLPAANFKERYFLRLSIRLKQAGEDVNVITLSDH